MRRAAGTEVAVVVAVFVVVAAADVTAGATPRVHGVLDHL